MNIKIENLTFYYPGNKKPSLEDINLEIKEGEIVSIFGESGSGKSTLLRMLAGLEHKGTGTIDMDGVRVLGPNSFVQPEKRGVGMVFQDYALFPNMNIEKNIAFGLNKMSNDKKKLRVKEMLELVNLEIFAKKYPHELSGGQQQRVALARALAPAPGCLLLDEPFSNLDTDLQERIRGELKEILLKAKVTTIFVTHDRADVRALADRVAVLCEGVMVNLGTVEETIDQ